MKRKLPPYARPIMDARRAGLVPARLEVAVTLDTWLPLVHVGRVVAPPSAPGGVAWSSLLDTWRPLLIPPAPLIDVERVVMPPSEPIDGFEWSFLRSLGVLVAWRSTFTDGERVMELARAILAVNPAYLILLDADTEGPGKAQWIKSIAHGVEVQP